MTPEEQRELMDKLVEALAAFVILGRALGKLGFIDIGPELRKSETKIKAAIFDVMRGEEPRL